MSEGAQNASTEQQPYDTDNFPSTEIKPYLDNRSGNAAAGKRSTKVTKQREAIMAGIVGVALLVVVPCALKIHVKTVVVVGTVRLG
jgi:hypothetical protein